MKAHRKRSLENDSDGNHSLPSKKLRRDVPFKRMKNYMTMMTRNELLAFVISKVVDVKEATSKISEYKNKFSNLNFVDDEVDKFDFDFNEVYRGYVDCEIENVLLTATSLGVNKITKYLEKELLVWKEKIGDMALDFRKAQGAGNRISRNDDGFELGFRPNEREYHLSRLDSIHSLKTILGNKSFVVTSVIGRLNYLIRNFLLEVCYSPELEVFQDSFFKYKGSTQNSLSEVSHPALKSLFRRIEYLYLHTTIYQKKEDFSEFSHIITHFLPSQECILFISKTKCSCSSYYFVFYQKLRLLEYARPYIQQNPIMYSSFQTAIKEIETGLLFHFQLKQYTDLIELFTFIQQLEDTSMNLSIPLVGLFLYLYCIRQFDDFPDFISYQLDDYEHQLHSKIVTRWKYGLLTKIKDVRNKTHAPTEAVLPNTEAVTQTHTEVNPQGPNEDGSGQEASQPLQATISKCPESQYKPGLLKKLIKSFSVIDCKLE